MKPQGSFFAYMSCLQTLAEELRAEVALFARADAELVSRGRYAAQALAPVASCQALRGTPQATPQITVASPDQALRLRLRLAEARALFEHGALAQSEQAATRLAAEAHAARAGGAQAEALVLLARCQLAQRATARAAATAREAVEAAQPAANAEGLTEAWGVSAEVAAAEARAVDAVECAALAAAALPGARPAPRLTAAVHRALTAAAGAASVALEAPGLQRLAQGRLRARLAWATWRAGEDGAQVQALTRRARQDLLAEGAAGQAELERLQVWGAEAQAAP